MFRRISFALCNSLKYKATPFLSPPLKLQPMFSHFPHRLFASSFPEHQVLGMPLLSPTMTQGTIVKWLKKEGEKVKAGEIMFEVETDKATLGFEVQDDVYLAKILEAEGSANLALGHPVAILVDNATDIGKFASYSAKSEDSKQKTEEVKIEKKDEEHHDARMSPAAHNLVLANHLDPSKIKPSGPKGLLLKSDVLSFIDSHPPKEEVKEQKPVTMVKTAKTAPIQPPSTVRAPRFSVTVECRLDKIQKILGPKVSLKSFIIKCAAQACTEVPEANGLFFSEFSRIFNYVDIQISSAADGKLQTYIVKDAHRKRVSEIEQDLAKPAKSDHTFEINFQQGVNEVQNPNTSALLSVGGIEKRVVLGESAPEVGEVAKFTLNCDHRIVDGAVGAKWLQIFKTYLTNPISLV
ncbi:unnamed protein product [Blepharisma stoltei]|uniref:Dihydrolipoamide acetyltransferase component of pyruvate dehydrogenase complex n=1 Tax=Blepharisma stoltei TaxID=1481888 RepID=A0AAU9JY10_9CILI|nr:unnamed protein product [Blepharisma stoltei]